MGCAAPPHRAVLGKRWISPATVAVAFPHRRHRHRRPARPHDGRGSALPPQLRGRSRGTRPGVANLRPRGRSPTCSPTTARWSTTAEFVRAVGRLPRQWRAFRRGLTESGEEHAGLPSRSDPARSLRRLAAPRDSLQHGITSDLTFDVVSFSPSESAPFDPPSRARPSTTFCWRRFPAHSPATSRRRTRHRRVPRSTGTDVAARHRPGWRTIRTGTARTTWR